MAKIRKRGSNYFIDYRIDGKRVRQSVGSSKEEAEHLLKAIEVKLSKKGTVTQQSFTALKDLFESFLQQSIPLVSPKTIQRYKTVLSNFVHFLSESHPDCAAVVQLTPAVFDEYQRARHTANITNRTINSEMIILRQMMRFAVDQGMLPVNPIERFKKLTEDARDVPRYLSDEECRSLLANSGEWLYPIMYTFLNTGLRKSELETLQWKDVDFTNKQIRIVQKPGSPKVDERVIPMHQGLMDVLTEQKKAAGNNQLAFPDEKGNQIHENRLRRWLMRLTKKLGFADVTHIYTLRHTFAARLAQKGIDINTIRSLMGHADIKTTMIYASVVEAKVGERLKIKGIEELGNGLDQNKPNKENNK